MNKVVCRTCGAVIASKTAHDFQQCTCANRTFTDGGEEYQRYGGVDLGQVEVVGTGDPG